MRDWPGIDDSVTDVGNDLSYLENGSHYVKGEMRRRPGLWSRMDLAGLVCSELRAPTNQKYIVHATDDGYLKSVQASDGTTVYTNISGLNAGIRGSMARANDRLYYANDWDAVQTVEGEGTGYEAGMDAPSSFGAVAQANGSNTSTGDHLVRFRWYNSQSLYYSNPSEAQTVTVGSSTEQLTWTIGSGGDIDTDEAPPQADQAIVEMTQVDGTVYYDAAFVNLSASSVVIDMSDTVLAQQTQTANNATTGHAKPPIARWLAEHRSRLFATGASVRTITATFTNASTSVTGSGFNANWAGRLVQAAGDTARYRIASATTTTLTLSEAYAGSTGSKSADVFSRRPDQLYWSEAGRPESWDTTTNARRVFQNEADSPSGIASYLDDLYIFGQNTMRRLVYDVDPGTGKLPHVPTDLGLWNQRCLVTVDGRLYGWGRAGAWVIGGILPRHISRPVDRTVGDDADFIQYEDFHAVFDPDERVIYWFYVPTGQTEPTKAMCLEVDQQKWSIRSFPFAIISSCLASDATEKVRAVVSDTNDNSWFLRRDRFDGVDSQFSAVVVGDTGSTTTVVNVTTTLQTDPTLEGVELYDPVADEARRIVSNTSSAITVSPAFTGAPPAGRELYIGRIQTTITSDWIPFADLTKKVRPSHLMLTCVPQSSQTVKVYIYKDFETNPLVPTSNASDQLPRGCTVGSDHILVDLSESASGSGSVASIPVPANFARVWRYKIVADKPIGTLGILDVRFAATRDDAGETEGE